MVQIVRVQNLRLWTKVGPKACVHSTGHSQPQLQKISVVLESIWLFGKQLAVNGPDVNLVLCFRTVHHPSE